MPLISRIFPSAELSTWKTVTALSCILVQFCLFFLGNAIEILAQPTAINPANMDTEDAGIYDIQSTIGIAQGGTLCQNLTDNKPLSIAVETAKAIYVPLQAIAVEIQVYNNNGCLLPVKVNFDITKVGSNQKAYHQSFISDTDQSTGFTENNYIALDQTGRYNITASTVIGGREETSWKIIEVQEIYFSRFSLFWFIALGFFTCLVILIIRGTANKELSEIFRFICISGIIFSILLSFIFLNEKVSEIAPIGIVTKDPELPDEVGIIDTSEGQEESILGDGQWVLNIGGQAPRYKEGIQIPIAVLIFGIAGGYLRYLYKTSKIYDEYKARSNISVQEEKDRIWLFYHSLQDISLLFLSPLLAIAVWFLLSQAGIQGQESIYTIAVISFAIGLITEEVILALIKFAGSALRVAERDKKGNESSPTKL
jgi:hypothetical protein